MDIREFWTLIEQTKADSGGDHHLQEILLIERLSTMTIEEIADYHWIFDDLSAQIHRYDIRDAAQIIEGGTGDDGFKDFCTGVIFQGLSVFEDTLRDPETLADILEAGDTLRHETLAYVGPYAYVRKTGNEDADLEFYELFNQLRPTYNIYPNAEDDYVPLEWTTDEEYERAIQERYPKLFKKFYLYRKSGSSTD
jgi:hypothetical protein